MRRSRHRLPHDGYSHRNGNSDSGANTDTHTDCYRNGDSNGGANTDTHADGDSDGNSDSDSNSDGYGIVNADDYSDANRDSDSNSNSHCDVDAYNYTHAHADSGSNNEAAQHLNAVTCPGRRQCANRGLYRHGQRTKEGDRPSHWPVADEFWGSRRARRSHIGAAWPQRI